MPPALWSDLAVIYTILVWVVLLGILWMVLIRPQRNRQRALTDMQSTIGPGDEVMLTSGIFGTVRAIDDERVEIEIAPGTTIQVARRAVLEQVLNKTDDDPEETPEETPDEAPESTMRSADEESE
jgi:preprotein translocase subunit YajC